MVDFDCIKNLLTQVPEGTDTSMRDHCKPFLPKRAARGLVQRRLVEATLKEELRFGEEDKSIIANYVTDKAKKVFLILVYIEADKKCWKILKDTAFSFSDKCLPIPGKKVGSQGDPTIGSLALSSRKKAEFLRDQWLFLAPTFQKRCFTYEFDHDLILPFVVIPNAMKDAGLFGKVYQLGLRVDHIEDSAVSATVTFTPIGPQKPNANVFEA